MPRMPKVQVEQETKFCDGYTLEVLRTLDPVSVVELERNWDDDRPEIQGTVSLTLCVSGWAPDGALADGHSGPIEPEDLGYDVLQRLEMLADSLHAIVAKARDS